MGHLASEVRYAVPVTRKPPSQQRLNEYMNRIKAIIQKHGWMVQGVFSSEGEEPAHCYTIGLTDAGLPELVVSGNMAHQTAMQILNAAAKQHLAKEIMPGDVVNDIANLPFRARAVDDLAPLQQALNYFRDPHNRLGRVRAIQLIWQDTKGAYPDQIYYDQSLPQPLF